MLTNENDPVTLKEARSYEQNSKWEVASQEETKALHANDNWNLVELSKGKNVILSSGCMKSEL